MIWLYWSAAVILIGAEINVFLQSRKSIRVSNTEEKLPRRIDVA
jgi:uncharacterized BrkB/YihY/UPF0761 family membrane protein